MATVSKWTPFGVALDITATGGTVTRTSATAFTVSITASWETYYSGAQTNYGMSATSGGTTATISAFDGTKRSSGSKTFTGTYSISGNGSATKSITVTFKNFNTDNDDSATKSVSFNVSVPAWTSYTVSYNANGGSGAPGSQTKWKNQTLTLSSAKPTRTGYSFLGWSTSSTATSATYSAGGSYTANSAATLYAVWELAYTKPRITNPSVNRCNSSSVISEDGTYALATFNWACDKSNPTIKIEWDSESGGSGSTEQTGSGTSGQASIQFGNGQLTTESTYTIKITVTDSGGYSSFVGTISGTNFLIDLLSGGKGMAFGKPAELEGVLDIGFKTRLLGGLTYPVLEPDTDLDTVRTAGIYSGANVTNYSYANCPITSGTFTLEVHDAGPDGQLLQRLKVCDKNNSAVYERYYYTSAWGSWYGGWIFPTLTSKFAMYGTSAADNQVRYRKEGSIVELRGIVTPTADIAGGTDVHDICTLPTGYRPTSPIYLVCQGSGNCTWLLRITSGGVVGMSRYRNGDTTITCSAGAWLPFQVTFFNK